MKNTFFEHLNSNVVMSEGKITHTNGWTPEVEEDSCSGTRVISLRTRHFTNGKIFLTGEMTVRV